MQLNLWPTALAAVSTAIILTGQAWAEVTEARARAVLTQTVAQLCPLAFDDPAQIAELTTGTLQTAALADVTDLGPADGWWRRTIRLEDTDGIFALELTATRAGGHLRRISFELHELAPARPVMLALASGDCTVHHGRSLRYRDDGLADSLVHFEADLTTIQTEEAINPPAPVGTDPGGVTVAHIDSGVNYTLPIIADRLARAPDGTPLGHDFWDDDPYPFDGDFARSPFFPIRHGTPVASLLVTEAPAVRLLPYRFPRPDLTRMTAVIEAAAEAEASIVAMPLGSAQAMEWDAFAAAAAAHPEMLFIVSAGNDGRDIDQDPVYPASLALDNMLVVTSSDAFGRLAQDSNWGSVSVDLMVPAEQLEVIEYRGARGRGSGSSYAVPRVAALAARLKATNPDWSTQELKRAVLARAVPPLERGPSRVAAGWIPNPADDL